MNRVIGKYCRTFYKQTLVGKPSWSLPEMLSNILLVALRFCSVEAVHKTLGLGALGYHGVELSGRLLTYQRIFLWITSEIFAETSSEIRLKFFHKFMWLFLYKFYSYFFTTFFSFYVDSSEIIYRNLHDIVLEDHSTVSSHRTRGIAQFKSADQLHSLSRYPTTGKK